MTGASGLEVLPSEPNMEIGARFWLHVGAGIFVELR